MAGVLRNTKNMKGDKQRCKGRQGHRGPCQLKCMDFLPTVKRSY